MKHTLLAKKMSLVAALLPALLLVTAITPRPSLAQQAMAPTGKVVAPPLGAQTNDDTARKQLKDNMDVQIAEFLKLHNDARAEVGAPPLVYDATLAAHAQEWADKLAAEGGALKHRTDDKYGENLAAYMPRTGMRVVHGAKLWYDEIKNYDAAGNTKIDPNGVAIGHYTQMVWRNSTKVGLGIAMADNGMAILCANYDPAGNFNNQHPYK